MKTNMTVFIRGGYLHYVRKYHRFKKRDKNLSVHLSRCFRDTQVRDVVTIDQCRPLYKTINFHTPKVTKRATSKKSFGKFNYKDNKNLDIIQS